MKHRIEQLLDQFMEDHKKGDPRLNPKWLISNQLRGYGIAAVDPILERLYRDHTSGVLLDNLAFYRLVVIVCSMAESHIHAHKLACMLLWDEVLWAEDRSVRVLLVDTLFRIGETEAVSYLEYYADQVGCIYDKIDRDEAGRTLKRCARRAALVELVAFD